MDNFETSISEILEVESVDSNDELESFDSWDSLTILSIIAFCYSEYKVVLVAEDLSDCNTIKGLKEFIKNNM